MLVTSSRWLLLCGCRRRTTPADNARATVVAHTAIRDADASDNGNEKMATTTSYSCSGSERPHRCCRYGKHIALSRSLCAASLHSVHAMRPIKKQVRVQLRTLTTWHCCRAPLHRWAIGRYLLQAGPQAQILPLWPMHVGTNRRTDIRTDTLPFSRPCSAYYAVSADKQHNDTTTSSRFGRDRWIWKTDSTIIYLPTARRSRHTVPLRLFTSLTV